MWPKGPVTRPGQRARTCESQPQPQPQPQKKTATKIDMPQTWLASLRSLFGRVGTGGRSPRVAKCCANAHSNSNSNNNDTHTHTHTLTHTHRDMCSLPLLHLLSSACALCALPSAWGWALLPLSAVAAFSQRVCAQFLLLLLCA